MVYTNGTSICLYVCTQQLHIPMHNAFFYQNLCKTFTRQVGYDILVLLCSTLNSFVLLLCTCGSRDNEQLKGWSSRLHKSIVFVKEYDMKNE